LLRPPTDSYRSLLLGYTNHLPQPTAAAEKVSECNRTFLGMAHWGGRHAFDHSDVLSAVVNARLCTVTAVVNNHMDE
jgi:hypothetical protein